MTEKVFRPRRVRPSGWLEQAIKDGTVRAPDAPDPDEGKDYSNATVVDVPLARLSAEANTPGGDD